MSDGIPSEKDSRTFPRVREFFFFGYGDGSADRSVQEPLGQAPPQGFVVEFQCGIGQQEKSSRAAGHVRAKSAMPWRIIQA